MDAIPIPTPAVILKLQKRKEVGLTIQYYEIRLLERGSAGASRPAI